MSAQAVQLRFAAEFVVFLAAAAGLATLVLRGRLVAGATWGRAAMAVGFAALAGAAFLHGWLGLEEIDPPAVVGLRLGGVALLGAGSLRWAGGPAARRLLWAGAALAGCAAALELSGAAVLAGVALAGGGVAIGASVVAASRRSIAARVAASAAVTLLVVVLVIAVALSAVLVSTVQEGEIDRLEARVANEAGAATTGFSGRLADAKVVAASLASDVGALVPLADGPPGAALTPQLSQLSSRFLSDVGLAYVGRSGAVQGAARLDPAAVVALAGSDVVRQAIEAADARGSVTVLAGRPVAVGVQPVRASVGGVPELLGVAAAVSELDSTYLDVAGNDDKDLSLALVGRSGVTSARGPQPPLPAIDSLVRSAIDGGGTASGMAGGRFVAVAPVRAADDRPLLAMVGSTPTTLVNATRDSLFRNLFVIALGGTLVALVLASLVGERIGAGLRRLTAAAEAIQRGQLDVRSGVHSEDEVGVLSATFDSMAGSIQDKTAAESRLRARLEAVVAGMGEALVAVDSEGRITDFNRAALELVGVEAGEPVGRPAQELVSLRDDEGRPVTPPWQSPPPQPWVEMAWLEQVGGSQVPVEVSAGALRGPDAEAAGTVLVLRDLRREHEVERMKTEFLSRVGHELRTPLTGIMGYADLLSRKEVPPDQARAGHAKILEQSRALLRIVEMLEFFASSGAGRARLRPEPVDPGVVVDEVVRRWGTRVGEPVTIGRRVRRGVPTVMADRRWLTLCLDELLDNAVKFSPDGGRITVTATPADGRGVEISVADRGKGMSVEEQARAFADFTQGDTSDTRAYGGLGLGLAFVHRVTEAHGGSVTCESVPGRGSKFSIFLPSVPTRSTS